MFLSQPNPYEHDGLFADRATRFGLCHDWHGLCSECLRRIAEFLANEIDWRLSEALDRGIDSYLCEIATGYATMEQARELRRYTVAACLRIEHERIGIPLASIDSVILADEVVAGESGRVFLSAEARAA